MNPSPSSFSACHPSSSADSLHLLSMNPSSSSSSSSSSFPSSSSSFSSSSSASLLSPMAPQFTFGTSVATHHRPSTFRGFRCDPYHHPAFGFWSEFAPPAAYYEEEGPPNPAADPCHGAPWDSKPYPHVPFMPPSHYFYDAPTWEPSAPAAAHYWGLHCQPDMPHSSAVTRPAAAAPGAPAIPSDGWGVGFGKRSLVKQDAQLELAEDASGVAAKCAPPEDGGCSQEKKIEHDEKKGFGERWKSFQDGSLFQEQHQELCPKEHKFGMMNSKNTNSKETWSWKCKPELEDVKEDVHSFGPLSGNEATAELSIMNQNLSNCRNINASLDSSFSRSYCSTMGVDHGCNEDGRLPMETDTNTDDKEQGFQGADFGAAGHNIEFESRLKQTENAADEDISLGSFKKERENKGNLQKAVLQNSNHCQMKKHEPEMASSHACQTIITSIHNLSEVLAKMLADHSNNAGVSCIETLQSSICVLSCCLLKQFESTRSTSQSGFAYETKFSTEPEKAKTSFNQESHEAETEGLHLSESSNFHLEQDAIKEIKHRAAVKESKCATGHSSQVLQKHNANFCIEAYIDRSQKEIAQLQAMFKRLQEEVSHEKIETTTVNETYKNIWKEAEEKMTSLLSEVKEIKLDVEFLKQTLKSQTLSVGCATSDANVVDLPMGSTGLTENLEQDNTVSVLGSSGRIRRLDGEVVFVSGLAHSMQKFEEEEDDTSLVGHCSSMMNTEHSMIQERGRIDLHQAELNDVSCCKNVNVLVMENDVLSRFCLLKKRLELESCNSSMALEIENSTWLPRNDVFLGVGADLSEHDMQEEAVEQKNCQMSQSKAENINDVAFNLSSRFVPHDASLPGNSCMDGCMRHDSLFAGSMFERSEHELHGEDISCYQPPVFWKDQSQRTFPILQQTVSSIYTRAGETSKGIEGESDWEHILPSKAVSDSKAMVPLQKHKSSGCSYTN